MQRILSSQLPAHLGETVTVAGWVHRRRLLKSVAFLIVRDAAGLTQVVVTDPDAARAARGAHRGDRRRGRPARSPRTRTAPAGVELTDPAVRVLGAPAAPPPFDLYRPRAHRDPAHPARPRGGGPAAPDARRRRCGSPRPRPPGSGRRSTQRGFVEIHTPKIVASATECGANVFALDYFGRPGLPGPVPAVLQAADGRGLRAGLRGRAGVPGRAARHRPAPGPVHVARRRARLHRRPPRRDGGAARRRGRHDATRSREPAARRRGARRCRRRSRRCTSPRRWRSPARPTDEPDLAPAHERALGEWALREHGSDFLFVTGYPMASGRSTPIPTRRRPAYSNGFDLLFRGLELVTGGQRLHRVRRLRGRAGGRGEPTGVRVLSGGVPARHAAARRVRHRAGAVRGPAARRGQRPRGHRVPARPAPPDAVSAGPVDDGGRGTAQPEQGGQAALDDRQHVGDRSPGGPARRSAR